MTKQDNERIKKVRGLYRGPTSFNCSGALDCVSWSHSFVAIYYAGKSASRKLTIRRVAGTAAINSKELIIFLGWGSTAGLAHARAISDKRCVSFFTFSWNFQRNCRAFEPSYLLFFIFELENSFTVSANATTIREKTATPVRKRMSSVIELPPNHHELEINTKTEDRWDPDCGENPFYSLPVKPQIARHEE